MYTFNGPHPSYQHKKIKTSHFLLPRRDQFTLLDGVVLPSTSQCRSTGLIGVLLDPGLEFGAEVSDKALNGPCESFTQSYNLN